MGRSSVNAARVTLCMAVVGAMMLAGGDTHAQKAGDRILAPWGAYRTVYVGTLAPTVTGAQAGVNWMDGTSNTVLLADVRPFDWGPGSKVLCMPKAEKNYKPGTLSAVSATGVTIVFAAGGTETVPLGKCIDSRKVEQIGKVAAAPAGMSEADVTRLFENLTAGPREQQISDEIKKKVADLGGEKLAELAGPAIDKTVEAMGEQIKTAAATGKLPDRKAFEALRGSIIEAYKEELVKKGLGPVLDYVKEGAFDGICASAAASAAQTLGIPATPTSVKPICEKAWGKISDKVVGFVREKLEAAIRAKLLPKLEQIFTSAPKPGATPPGAVPGYDYADALVRVQVAKVTSGGIATDASNEYLKGDGVFTVKGEGTELQIRCKMAVLREGSKGAYGTKPVVIMPEGQCEVRPLRIGVASVEATNIRRIEIGPTGALVYVSEGRASFSTNRGTVASAAGVPYSIRFPTQGCVELRGVTPMSSPNVQRTASVKWFLDQAELEVQAPTYEYTRRSCSSLTWKPLVSSQKAP